MKLVIITVCLLVTWSLYTEGTTIAPCEKYVQYSELKTNTGYRSYSYKCSRFPNWLKWVEKIVGNTFDKTCHGTESFTQYETVYNSRLECCSGYDGYDCLPKCGWSGCGTNMECSSPNICTCIDGWSGHDCKTAICNPSCGANKKCSSPNKCTCNHGWSGHDCKTAICNPSCGANKKCSSPNKCTCNHGWSGHDCKTAICNPSCGANKECSSPNKCTCIDGWEGHDCKTAICNPSCGANKECSSPNKCTCIDGWEGHDCKTAICNPFCGANEECSSPNKCTCIDGWEGEDCLTDIDECLDEIDSCEDGCTNVNGSYSCFCDNTYEILGIDGKTCLDGVNDVIGTSGVDNITLAWSSPANVTDDGTFSGYNITCSNADDVMEKFVSLPLTTYTFLSLTPFTLYKCCIIPQWTTNGVGPPVCIEQQTLEDAPDDSPRNVSVIAADSSSVLIQWLPPNIPNGIVTQYNVYVNYTNGSNITSYTVDGKYSTLSLLEGLQVFQLVGVSISATTGGGEGPMSLYVYNRSEETEPDPIRNMVIHSISNNSVNVSWNAPISLKGIIINYHVAIMTKNLINNKWILNSSARHFIIEDLKPFIPYQVEITAATKIGKGDNVQKTFFTNESVPSVAPKWSIIQRTSARQAELEWTHLSLEESRGYITGYSIIYAESVYACSLTGDEITVITDNDHLQLNELNPRLEYCIRIAASTSIGEGIYSSWKLVEVYDRKIIFVFISGTGNCESWREHNSQAEKQDMLLLEFASVMRHSCQCNFTIDYIQEIEFLPCSNKRAVLKLSVIQNNKLLKTIKQQISPLQTIFLDGVNLTIVDVCEQSDCRMDDSHGTSRSTSGTTLMNLLPTVTLKETNNSNNGDKHQRIGNNIMKENILVTAVMLASLIFTVIAVVLYIIINKRKSEKNKIYTPIPMSILKYPKETKNKRRIDQERYPDDSDKYFLLHDNKMDSNAQENIYEEVS